jgi:hypothetical protein
MRRFIMFGENDAAGHANVSTVTRALTDAGHTISSVFPPAGFKDVRAWKIGGIASAELESYIAQHAKAGDGKPRREIPMLSFDQIPVERTEWLWGQGNAGYIPIGEPVLIAGAGEIGKGTLTDDLIARSTRGLPGPDGSPLVSGSWIITSAEESPGRRRLRQEPAGADLSKIYSASMVKQFDAADAVSETAFTLDDLQLLRDLIGKIKAKGERVVGIVIDPIGSYVGHVDTHRDAELRTVLAPLAKLAADERLAVVLICHTGKQQYSRAVDTILGSVAFGNFAREVLWVGRDPDDLNGPHRILACAKSNVGIKPAALPFTIESVPENPTVPRIVWHDPLVDETADSILRKIRAAENSECNAGSGVEVACDWLSSRLGSGPRAVADLQKEYDEQKDGALFSWETLKKKAAPRLDVWHRKVGFGADSKWYWGLPGQTLPISPKVTINLNGANTNEKSD